MLIRPAKLVLLVMEPDRSVLHSTPASLAAIQRLAGRNVAVWPVINKLDVGEEAFQREVEQTLRRPVRGVLPWASRASAQALADGRPVVLGQPNTQLAAAVHKLADQIDEMLSTQPLRRILTIKD
jgi:MinD-like ATPase involved in chromosome partitioning or flagellar assembly